MKKCTVCKTLKDVSCFYVRASRKNGKGLHSMCKDCEKAQSKAYRKKVGTRVINNKRKAKDLVRYKVIAFRANTKRRTDLPLPDITELTNLIRQQLVKGCYYTGVFIDETDFGIDHKVPLARGGDNSLDNLCAVAKSTNNSKGALTDTEFFELLKLISTWEDKGVSLLKRLRMGGGMFGRKK